MQMKSHRLLQIAIPLHSLIFSTFIRQLISEPTRTTETSKTLIDLCITNSKNVVNLGVFHLGISDHSLVYMTRKVNYARIGGSSIIVTRQFKRFKADNFLQDLKQKDWNCIAIHSDPNKMWDAWRNLMMSAIDKHPSLKKKRVEIGRASCRERV